MAGALIIIHYRDPHTHILTYTSLPPSTLHAHPTPPALSPPLISINATCTPN